MSSVNKSPKSSRLSVQTSSDSTIASRRNQQSKPKPDNVFQFGIRDTRAALKRRQPNVELEAGFYTWRLADNVLRGDAAVARLFGYGPDEVSKGMSVFSYMDRIHPDDRAHVADIVKDALLSSCEYQATYRLARPDGTTITVSAHAHLFKDEEADPGTWVGLVHPLVEASDNSALIQQCLAAYTLVCTAGYVGVAGKLREALSELVALLG